MLTVLKIIGVAWCNALMFVAGTFVGVFRLMFGIASGLAGLLFVAAAGFTFAFNAVLGCLFVLLAGLALAACGKLMRG